MVIGMGGSMKQLVAVGIVVLGMALLSGCDDFGSGKQASGNKGNVSVVPNEGRLVGRGRMEVDGHLVEVQKTRIMIDGQDYGGVPEGAEIYFRSNGDYRLVLVNGEERRPVTKH